jgi:CHAT domain-containing protein
MTLVRIILVAGVLLGAVPSYQAGAQPAPASLATPADGPTPPRTVHDITGVLGAYKPDPQRAASRKAQADQQPPAGGDDGALATFFYERGIAAGQVGRIGQQLDDLRRALDHAGKAGSDRSRILQRLAPVEAQVGNFANAIRYAEERAEIDDRQGARGRLFASYAQLVHFNVKRGSLDEAARWVARSKEMFADHGENPGGRGGGGRGGGRRGGGGGGGNLERRQLAQPGWRAQVAAAEAELMMARGRYVAAEALLRTAIEQEEIFLRNWEQLPADDRPPRENLENVRNEQTARLAHALLQQSKPVAAEVEARRSLVNTLRQVGRDHAWTAMRLGQVGLAVLGQGRSVEAEQLARAAIAIYERVDATRSWGLASARGELGSALVAQERWADALASYDAMVAGLAGDELGARRFAVGNLDWATALLKTGRVDPAIAMVTRQLEYRRKVFGEQHYGTALARAYLGMALAAKGQRQPALQAFRDSLPILLASAQNSEEDSGTTTARRLHLVLDAYIRLLADIKGTPIEANAGVDAAAEAFRLADAARGQRVQKALEAASARVTLRDPALVDLARREQDAGQELVGLEATLIAALAAPADQQDAASADALRQQIAQLRKTRDGLRQEIARRFPDYAELINPKPATIEQTRRTLRAGEALVALYGSGDATLVWAVSQQGGIAFSKAPLGASQLDKMVKQLRRALDPQAQTSGEVPAFDVALAGQLYDALLKPVEAGWKGAQSLFVVVDGALAQLPLGVLVTQPTQRPSEVAGQPMFAGYKTVPWLARDVAITQLPAASSLVTLRALPAASATRKPFIGFGDPVFGTRQVADAGGLTLRGVRLAMRSIPKVERVDSAELAMLPRLPDTADEVRSIARALKADPERDVFVGSAATERTVKAMLGDRRVIVFATHGLVPGDLDGLTQPALALSSPQAGGDGDGLLTMDEVLGLKLDADWVVLSACNSAAGDGAGAEAISGLGRAFFYAGARALLVSNWPVETSSARTLTTDLFRRQSEEASLSRAQALRRAELALIDGPGTPQFSYAHPIFWAPFSLVGDGG